MTSDPDDAPRPASIEVEVVVTLDDHYRFNLALAARPEARRRRRVWQVAVIVLAPLIGFAGGLVSAHLNGDGRQLLLQALGDIPATDWWHAGAVMAAGSGLVAATTLLMQLVRKPLLRWQVRRLLSQRPGIDPHDPERREAVRVTFDAEGYTATNAASATSIRWPFVRGINDSQGLLIVQVGRKGGFILPKRELSAEHLVAIPAFVAAHAGRSTSAMPPART